jgi:cystathionine beta-lyase/cystathionine gamma-synthase
MLPRARVHALSTTEAALTDFLDDAEASFLEYGVAPDVGRVTALENDELERFGETPPGEGDENPLAYIAPETVAALEDATEYYYAGISGMAVVDRIVRETTGPHAEVVMQSHAYEDRGEYTVYRYDHAGEEFLAVASGSFY